MRLLIAEDINNGVIINDLFNCWNAAKTQKQADKAMKAVMAARFGTYKNQTILDIITQFEIKSRPFSYNDFITKIKKEIGKQEA